MTPPVLDEHSFDDLQARLGVDFVRELVATFDDEAPRLVQALRAAAAAGTAAPMQRAAHMLQGDTRTFGATRLAACLQRLAQAGPGDATALDAVAAEVEVLRDALRARAAR